MPTIVPSDYGPIDIDAREAQQVSGVAIFNPAIKGKTDAEDVCIVLAISGSDLLVVDASGRLSWRLASQITVDWRYDFKNERWTDTAGESLEAEAE